MTRARSALVSLADTPWYHVVSRCVPVRTFLAGRGDTLDAATLHAIDEIAEKYRARLHDLSWFMRMLNESIARHANAEDEVTGRFWEGRFKSQALLDEQAILSAMTYVDLNPIRAPMADTPERSEFTSVAERIGELTRAPSAVSATTTSPAASLLAATPAAGAPDSLVALCSETRLASLPKRPLMPFDATARLRAAIPFALDDYLELVETVGRCMRSDKRGAIPIQTPKLLDRLGITPDQFITCATSLMRQFGSAVGAPANLLQLCAARQIKYLRGMAAARGMFERKAA